MQLIADIIDEVLDAIANISWHETPTELMIHQGLAKGEWWVHTDMHLYAHVVWLRDIGLTASVFEYLDDYKVDHYKLRSPQI